MINYRFKKANRPGPAHDRSFYAHFTLAWTNLLENEVESRLRILSGDSKTKKAVQVASRELTR